MPLLNVRTKYESTNNAAVDSSNKSCLYTPDIHCGFLGALNILVFWGQRTVKATQGWTYFTIQPSYKRPVAFEGTYACSVSSS